jgi:hypothetical protein
MNQFEITLQGLANNELETITFPADESEVAEAIAKVSNYGQNDFEIVDYDAPFKIDGLNVALFNEIAEFPKEKYDAFITFCNCGDSMKEAFDYVSFYEYRVFEDCEDMGDVARQFLEHDPHFQEAPSFMRIHFDYDSYGETLSSCGTWFEDTKNKRFIELF